MKKQTTIKPVIENKKKSEPKFLKIKRHSKITPISAYVSRHWLHYAAEIYEAVYGEVYKAYFSKTENKIRLESLILTKYVYPIVFDRYQWSAQDFARFLKHHIIFCHKNKQDYSISYLKSKISRNEIHKFHRENVKEGKDFFSSLVEIPHTPFTGQESDLSYVLRTGCFTNIQILCNFGFSIFNKFIQLSENKSFWSSFKKTEDIFYGILKSYRSDTPFLNKIVDMIFMNSVLWEPYLEQKHVKGMKTQGNICLDWREKFKEPIRTFKIEEKSWWRTKEQTDKVSHIKTVGKFFKSTDFFGG